MNKIKNKQNKKFYLNVYGVLDFRQIFTEG